MYKWLLIYGMTICLTACGGGDSHSGIEAFNAAGCDAVGLTEDLKEKLTFGLTIGQANEIIGCEAEEYPGAYETFIWNNFDTIGFGVTLNDEGQVNRILDLEDRVKCPSVNLTQSIAISIQKDMTRQQVDLLLGCSGQTKSVDGFDLNEGVARARVQYLNERYHVINVLFLDGVAAGRGSFSDLSGILELSE